MGFPPAIFQKKEKRLCLVVLLIYNILAIGFSILFGLF